MINDNQMVYGSWKMKSNECNFWSFFTFFSHLPPWKIKIFEEIEKAAGDTIILHMCATYENHVIFGSWDMESNGHNIL